MLVMQARFPLRLESSDHLMVTIAEPLYREMMLEAFICRLPWRDLNEHITSRFSLGFKSDTSVCDW